MCHTEVNCDLVERRVAAVDADYESSFAKSFLFPKPGSKVRCPKAKHGVRPAGRKRPCPRRPTTVTLRIQANRPSERVHESRLRPERVTHATCY